MKHIFSFLLLCGMLCTLAFAQSDNKRVTYYDDGGIKSEGHLVGGEKEGPWIYYFEGPGKKKQMEGIYKGGHKSNHWKTYYRSQQIKAEGGFIIKNGDSVKNGTWTWYHKNGVKKEEGDYKNGHKVGNWYEWNSLEIELSKRSY